MEHLRHADKRRSNSNDGNRHPNHRTYPEGGVTRKRASDDLDQCTKMKQVVDDPLRQKLIRLRRERKLSQMTMAERLDICSASYHRLEAKPIATALSTLYRICEILDTNPFYLLKDGIAASSNDVTGRVSTMMTIIDDMNGLDNESLDALRQVVRRLILLK